MTAPQDPQNPYGRPSGYPPGGADPGYGPPPGYPYQGYGAPAGLPYGAPGPEAEPARRPGTVTVALVLLLLSALPFLLGGIAVLLGSGDLAIPPEVQEQFDEAGVTTADIVAATQVAGVIMAALAALFVLLAVLAFAGRRGARIAVTVLTVLFALLLLPAGLFALIGDPVSGLIVLAVIGAAIVGVVLLFSPAASRWYAAPRR
ncbi:MAG TPA: hypothetical protein VM367_05230 [Pseudonocardia sp.]|nr:hypothetical protein [Pseudonocardia sp.]